MKKNVIYFFILLGFLTGLNAQTLQEYLSQGDNYYEQFNNEKALEFYQKADVAFPDNWEVLWRISRAYVDIAEHMPSSTNEQEDAQIAKYNLALEYANRAVKIAPNQSVTYLRRAIANGKIALFKGVFSVAGVVNQVKADCEKAISIRNGGNDIQGVAHYVYARTHAKISEKWKPGRSLLGLGWANIETALSNYEKAIQLKPNFMMFYVDYAKALISEDDYNKAREMLKKAISCKNEDEDDAKLREEAKQLLKKIEKE
jgi:tetratricopeptide (TPR) repeat protein